MATKIELEIRIRELERRLENDEQDMVDVFERIERLESERDEYRRSSNDWARHFKMERTARISAEAEVARLRDVCEKLIQLDNEKLICLSGQLSYEESNKVRKAVIAMRQAIDNEREQ
jgi:hypothetical protein